MDNKIVKNLIIMNFTVGRPGSNGILYGVFHSESDSKNDTQLTVLEWWNNPQAKSSAHGLVGLDGGRLQAVDYSNTAWHAANWAVNISSIGIEHEDNGNSNDPIRTNALYASSAQWVVELFQQFNIPIKLVDVYPRYLKDGKTPHPKACQPVEPGWVRHRQVSLLGTACPGALDCERIIKQANEILNSIQGVSK